MSNNLILGDRVVRHMYRLAKKGIFGVGAERESFLKMFGITYAELCEVGERELSVNEVDEVSQGDVGIDDVKSKKKAGRKPKVKK